jgi:hypothetical protein
MRTWIILAVLGCSGLTAACAYPVSTVDQGGGATGLYFPNASISAEASVDGAAIGPVARYDGRKAILTLAPGTHHVTVRDASGQVYDKDVYVGAGARLAIKVH